MNLTFKQPSPKMQGIAGLCWGILYFLALISQGMIIDPASPLAGLWQFIHNMHYAIMIVVGVIFIQWSLEKIGIPLHSLAMYKFNALVLGILVLLGAFGYLGMLQPYFWIILLIAGIQLAILGLRSL